MQLKGASLKVMAILYLLALFFPVTFYLASMMAEDDHAFSKTMMRIGMIEGVLPSLQNGDAASAGRAVETVDRALIGIKNDYLQGQENQIALRLYNPDVAYATLIGSWQEIQRLLSRQEIVSDLAVKRFSKDIQRLTVAVRTLSQAQQERRLYLLYGALFVAMLLILLQIYFLRRYLNRHETQNALTDSATKLYNRTYFLDEVVNASARAKRSEEPLSLIFFAIDDFEQHGLERRSELVEAFGRLLLPLTRSSDVACRVGENEYVIIAPKTEAERVQILVERIRKVVAKDLQVADKGVTISAGIAQLRQEEEPQACVMRAEKTMCEAKKYGNKTAIAP